MCLKPYKLLQVIKLTYIRNKSNFQGKLFVSVCQCYLITFIQGPWYIYILYVNLAS